MNGHFAGSLAFQDKGPFMASKMHTQQVIRRTEDEQTKSHN